MSAEVGTTVKAPTRAAVASGLEVTLRPVTLDGQKRRFGALELLAGYELISKHAHFGGLSALAFSADGARLIFVSDRGHWFSARAAHDDNGVLRALSDWRGGTLHGPDGRTFAGTWRDAESLTTDATGALIVGFENHHRLLRYARGLDGRPTTLPAPAALRGAPLNGSLEAITTLPDGRLLLLCENYRYADGTLRGWLSAQASSDAAIDWRELRYVESDGFRPTEIKALPTGELLVLERFFSPFRGLAARIRRVDAADVKPDARLVPHELARLDRGNVDNFEGLAVRYDKATQQARIYIVSDDNFNAFQRTLLYQFRLLR